MMSLSKAIETGEWLLEYRRKNPDRFRRDTDEQRLWDKVLGTLRMADYDPRCTKVWMEAADRQAVTE